MPRLKTASIASKIREYLAAYTFRDLTLISVPTGRDPRTFTDTTVVPAACVEVTDVGVRPKAVGGASESLVSIRITIVFPYEEGDDIGQLKERLTEDLFDFLCANKVSADLYKLFISDGEGAAWPMIDLQPEVEKVYYAAGHRLAAIDCAFAARQIPFFTIN